MRKTIFLLLTLLAGCRNAGVNPVITLGQPFWLKPGESRLIEPTGGQIGFDRVLSDTRCPREIECDPTIGLATIQLWLWQPPEDTAWVEVSIPAYVYKSDTDRHESVDALGYRITLMQLDPYPEWNRHHRPADPADYKALLVVWRP